jgi:uncharacterized protein YbaA (DUF1428 family)
MTYVEGFVAPVPATNKDTYRAFASTMAPLFQEYGATRVVENWGSDVPRGKTTDFWNSVKCEPGEAVVFSWIEWPSKAVRDAAWPKIQSDPRMRAAKMPFDGKRMIFGGFETVVDTAKKPD